MKKRQAIKVSTKLLNKWLKLSEDTELYGINHNLKTDIITFFITGDNIGEVPEGGELISVLIQEEDTSE